MEHPVFVSLYFKSALCCHMYARMHTHTHKHTHTHTQTQTNTHTSGASSDVPHLVSLLGLNTAISTSPVSHHTGRQCVVTQTRLDMLLCVSSNNPVRRTKKT